MGRFVSVVGALNTLPAEVKDFVIHKREGTLCIDRLGERRVALVSIAAFGKLGRVLEVVS